MPRAKRGFGTIEKMRSGRYQVRYIDHSGRRVSAGRTFRTKVDAEVWAVQRRREIDAGRRDAERPKPLTFAAYSATWLENRHVAGRPIKARTREHYRNILDDHLLPAFGERKLCEIDRQAIEEFLLFTRPIGAHALIRCFVGQQARCGELVDRILGAAGLPPVKRSIPYPLAYAAGCVLELVHAILRRSDDPLLSRFLVDELSTAHWFDLRAARRDLGYEPKVSLEEGLRRLRASLRKN